MYFGSVFWYVLPVVSLLIRGNSIKIWTYFLLILILYFLFRIILAFIHHILRYVADDLSYYGSSAREREKLNIDYKVKMDRYYASKAYIICQMLILGILTYFQNGDGIISSIIIAIILNLPLLILLREPTDYSIGSNNLSNTSSHQESGNKKKKQKSISDIDYKKTYIKDKFGNVVGSASTYGFGDEIKYTKISDDKGNTIGESIDNEIYTEYKFKK